MAARPKAVPTIDTIVGANITFDVNANGTAASSNLDLAGPVTSASDVINLDAFMLTFGSATLNSTSLSPSCSRSPEQINVKNPFAIAADAGASISFNTLPITAASYANGTLSLAEAGHVMPMKISGRGERIECPSSAEICWTALMLRAVSSLIGSGP